MIYCNSLKILKNFDFVNVISIIFEVLQFTVKMVCKDGF